MVVGLGPWSFGERSLIDLAFYLGKRSCLDIRVLSFDRVYMLRVMISGN